MPIQRQHGNATKAATSPRTRSTRPAILFPLNEVTADGRPASLPCWDTKDATSPSDVGVSASAISKALGRAEKQFHLVNNVPQLPVALGPILDQIGAIEEERVEEAVSRLASLLTRAIKDAKAKHGAGKRVRVFLRFGDPGAE